MDHAVNRAPVSHEMSTGNVGAVLPAERGPIMGEYDLTGEVSGIRTRNAFEQGGLDSDAGGDADNRFGCGEHQ